MNERIKELSELADNMADEEIQMPGEFHPNWHDVRDQFFAELIVRECAEFACQHNLERAKRSHMIHKAIKEHFGVTE